MAEADADNATRFPSQVIVASEQLFEFGRSANAGTIQRLAALRREAAARIDQLIAFLDATEGDTDLEEDDREHDPCDLGERDDEGESPCSPGSRIDQRTWGRR